MCFLTLVLKALKVKRKLKKYKIKKNLAGKGQKPEKPAAKFWSKHCPG